MSEAARAARAPAVRTEWDSWRGRGGSSAIEAPQGRWCASGLPLLSPSDVSLEAAYVEQQDWNDEQEDEDGDRGADPELRRAAERGSPQRQCQHVCIRLN